MEQTIKQNHNPSMHYIHNGTEIAVLFTDEYCSFYLPYNPEPIFAIKREIVERLAHQWLDGTEVCPACDSDNLIPNHTMKANIVMGEMEGGCPEIKHMDCPPSHCDQGIINESEPNDAE